VRFDVTEHPTASWLSQQVTEAFPWDSSALSAARSRRLVWHKLPPTDRSDGHRRGHNCAALTLAECLRRAGHRFDTPRVSGPPRHLQRAPSAPRLHILPRLLPSHPDASFLGQRITLSSGRYRRPRSEKSSPSPKSVVCTIATSASRRDSSHSPLMPPQRPVPHRPRISWSKPAHLIRLETVTDFDRSCFRVRPAERFSLSRPLKFPFRSNFQQGQSGHQNLRRELLQKRSIRWWFKTQKIIRSRSDYAACLSSRCQSSSILVVGSHYAPSDAFSSLGIMLRTYPASASGHGTANSSSSVPR
jgi:hypothetical protein